MKNKVFNERLRLLRESEGMTQKDFAEEINITPATLSSYETGAKMPNLSVVVDITQRFNISSDWLIGNEIESKTITIKDFIKTLNNLLQQTDDAILLFLDPDIQQFNNNIQSIPNKLRSFFSKYKEMLKLYKDETIKKELLDLWLNNELQNFPNESYQEFVENCFKEQNLPDDFSVIAADDDLPF